MPDYVLTPRKAPFYDPNGWGDARRMVVEMMTSELRPLAALNMPPDARFVSLDNVEMLFGTATMILNALDGGAQGPDEALMVRDIFGLTTMTNLQEAADLLDLFTRNAVITLTQFQIEAMFSNTLLAVGIAPHPGWGRVSRQALTYFGYPAVDRAVRVLKVPAAIRNTLHNNGIHRGPDLSVQISGYPYRFRNGRQCSLAGWGHIVHAVRAELRVIERFLLLPSLRAVSFVPEPYALSTGAVAPD